MPSYAEGIIPHSIYDLRLNGGYIQLGTSHDTSTTRRKSFDSSDSQGASSVSPVERFSHCAIEVVDEVQDALPQVVERTKAGSLQQLANQNTEPKLHLI